MVQLPGNKFFLSFGQKQVCELEKGGYFNNLQPDIPFCPTCGEIMNGRLRKCCGKLLETKKKRR